MTMQTKLLNNFLNHYIEDIKLDWTGIDFIYDRVHLLYYKYNK